MAARKKLVRIIGHDRFIVAEDFPVITAAGVELTAAEVTQAEEAAKASRVVLLIDDEVSEDTDNMPPVPGEGS